MKVTVIPVVNMAFPTIPQRIGKAAGRLSYQRTSGDHRDNLFIKIDQNTENSPGDLPFLKLH